MGNIIEKKFNMLNHLADVVTKILNWKEILVNKTDW